MYQRADHVYASFDLNRIHKHRQSALYDYYTFICLTRYKTSDKEAR